MKGIEMKEMGWEPLGGGFKILVSKEHSFNTDTLLLADFAAPNKNYICADFGTGCGTIAVIWAARYKPQKIVAVELQRQAFLQVSQSVEENNISSIELINGDLRQYKSFLKNGSLDLIACNPPYKAQGAGVKNPVDNMRIARHEDELTMEELAKAAAFSLKFGGKLCICQRPERLADAMSVFRANNLEPKRLRLVEQRAGKAASLFLLECRRGGKSGLTILPTLYIEQGGEYSAEMLRIYGSYKEE